jgi:hypothetical protein
MRRGKENLAFTPDIDLQVSGSIPEEEPLLPLIYTSSHGL